MKLIMIHEWGEEYEEYGTDVLPFEYSSKEDAELDFLVLAEEQKIKHQKFTNWQRELNATMSYHKDGPDKYMTAYRDGWAKFAEDFSHLPYFKFLGNEFNCHNQNTPRFYTLEEWFEEYKIS